LNTITGGKSTRKVHNVLETLLKDLCEKKRTDDYVKHCHENGGWSTKSETLET